MQTPRNLYNLLTANIASLAQLRELVQILKKNGGAKKTIQYWESEIDRVNTNIVVVASGIADKVDLPGSYDSNG